MKQLFSKIIILLFTMQFAYGIVGFGIYGNMDSFSQTFAPFGTTPLVITPSEIDNAYGAGGYFYIDAIPFIDIQADIEAVANTYDFSIANLDVPIPMGWGRISTYFSVRKKIFGIGIPFLAKAQLFGGAGINSHNVTPKLSSELIVNSGLETILEDAIGNPSSFNATDFGDKLLDYAQENRETFKGAHVMVGLQAKLLTFNMIANFRYTMAKDVIPGKSGFPSAYIGLGIGI